MSNNENLQVQRQDHQTNILLSVCVCCRISLHE